MDANSLTLPLWSMVGIASLVASALIWAFNMFERKEDAKQKHTALSETLKAQGELLQEVSRDISFVRGKIEQR